MPYYNPVVLARRLSTIDVLSNGRLLVGLGLSWSKDEMDATGADMTKRGALADEFLQVLKTIWTTNPVEFRGQIADDVSSCAKIGVSEIFFEPVFSQGGQSLDRWLSLMDQLRGMTLVS